MGVERPTLRHFTVAASTVTPHDLARSADIGSGSLWPLAVLSLAGLGAVTAWSLRQDSVLLLDPRRLKRAAGPMLGALLMLVALALPSAATVPGRTPAGSRPALHDAQTILHRTPSTSSVLWQRLTAIEDQLGHHGQLLATLSQLSQQTAVDDSELSPPRGRHRVVADPAAVIAGIAAQYQAEIQAEYAFFETTVRDEGQRQALLDAAQTAPPEVRDAVGYDVGAVQAQLAQEAAIAAAQQATPRLLGAAPRTLAFPIAGGITQGFGPSTLDLEPPFNFQGITYPHFHTGIDIAGPMGAPVHAAAPGIVVLAGPSTDGQGHLVGYGNYVVIAHAGRMITLYAHLQSISVRPGQAVTTGDVIGAEGSTGSSTGPHVHFEVRVAGMLLNPMVLLRY